MCALGFGRFGYTMILPSMQESMGLSPAQAGDMAAANMAGYLMLAVVAGFLGSRFGSRIVITVSMLAVAVSMLWTGLSGGYWSALFSRFLSGAAGGGVNIPVIGLLVSWFSSKNRGLASGFGVCGSSIALLFTGAVVPGILDIYGVSGWRQSWFLLAAISVVVTLLCALFLRDRHRRDERKTNSDSRIDGLEENIPKPPVHKPGLSVILKSINVWKLSFIYIAFGFSYVIYVTFFARTLTAEGGFTTGQAGTLWSIVGGVSIASGFIWGGISDRIGRKWGLALVFLLQCLSFGAMGLWHSPAGVYVSCFFFAVTAWSIPVIMAASTGDLLGPRMASAGFGVITLFFGIGQISGPFFAGRITELTGSYYPAFTVAGAAALVGSVLSAVALPRVMSGGHDGKTHSQR